MIDEQVFLMQLEIEKMQLKIDLYKNTLENIKAFLGVLAKQHPSINGVIVAIDTVLVN